jgi:hypothetical protein
MKGILKINKSAKVYHLLFLLLIAVGLQFCTPKAKPTVSNNTYQEDLSIYRSEYKTNEAVEDTASKIVVVEPKIDVIPKYDLRDELDSINSILIASRKGMAYIDGFNIQLYSGNDRDKANEVTNKANELINEIKPMMSYEQPNYKVKVGPYYSRIEANVHFNILKKTYVRAVLVPAKIKIESN